MSLKQSLLTIGCVLALIACGDDDGPGGTGGSGGTGGNGGTGGSHSLGDCVEIDNPTGAATFDAIYDEVLCTNTCMDSFCHGGSASGNLRLDRREEAFAALVGTLADGDECAETGLTRVVPFNAAMSLLVQKLRPNPVCGDAMPQGVDITGEGYVIDAQIEQIEAWINAGALRHPPQDMDAGENDASTDDAGN